MQRQEERPDKVKAAAGFLKPGKGTRAPSAFLVLMTLLFPTRVADTRYLGTRRGCRSSGSLDPTES
jgi:hypothetical protein